MNHNNQQPGSADLDECAAAQNGHRFGPHGIRGEQQCEWCGAAPAVEQSAEKVELPIFCYAKQVHSGWPEFNKEDEFSDGEGGGEPLVKLSDAIAASRRTTVGNGRDSALESAVQAVANRAGDAETILVVSAFDAIRKLKENRFALSESVATPVSAGQAVQVAPAVVDCPECGIGIAHEESCPHAAPVSPPDGAMPRIPTEAMLNAARDWSVEKYRQGIGNDAATGCWQAMYDAAQPAEGSAQVAVARVVGSDTVIGRERRSLEWQKGVKAFDFEPGTLLYAMVEPVRSDTPASMFCPQCGVDRLKAPCPGMADECAMMADAYLLDGDKQGAQGDSNHV